MEYILKKSYTFSRADSAHRKSRLAAMSAAPRPKAAAATAAQKAKNAAPSAVDPSGFLDAALREQLAECVQPSTPFRRPSEHSP
jgi:hypothetical protein